jgi:hypothetical protein
MAAMASRERSSVEAGGGRNREGVGGQIHSHGARAQHGVRAQPRGSVCAKVQGG